jgi:HSP20 family protein
MTTKTEETLKPKIRKGKQEVARQGGPREQLPSPFEEMEKLFDSFFPRGWLQPRQWDWPAIGEMAMPFAGRMPRVDVIDRDAEVLVRAELPGVEKDDLDVTVTDDAVTIKASTRHEKQEEKGDYHRCEISRGAFARSISLPAGVDAENARATFHDGLLELTLPKLARQGKRRIEVE